MRGPEGGGVNPRAIEPTLGDHRRVRRTDEAYVTQTTSLQRRNWNQLCVRGNELAAAAAPAGPVADF